MSFSRLDHKNKVLFITGTDTEIGKSVVTGLLARYLLEKGHNVVTQKWIQTGYNGVCSDIDVHLKFMKKKREDFQNYLSFMMPYAFKFPSSPHLASQLEKKRIKVDRIKKSMDVLKRDFDIVLVEGAGGLMVPINKKCLLIELVARFKLPTIIVAGNRLGAINHLLLTVEALERRKIPIVGIIFNNLFEREEPIILENNVRIISELSGCSILGVLPRVRNLGQLQVEFNSIGDKIRKIWING